MTKAIVIRAFIFTANLNCGPMCEQFDPARSGAYRHHTASGEDSEILYTQGIYQLWHLAEHALHIVPSY